jgi:hypothetical protein
VLRHCGSPDSRLTSSAKSLRMDLGPRDGSLR